MSATLRTHRIRKSEEEPKYKITVEKGPSILDRMGIPKEAERKAELIARLQRLGTTDEQIQRAFEEMETFDHADIEGVA